MESNKDEFIFGNFMIIRGLIWIFPISHYFNRIVEHQGINEFKSWIGFLCAFYQIFTVFTTEQYLREIKCVSYQVIINLGNFYCVFWIREKMEIIRKSFLHLSICSFQWWQTWHFCRMLVTVLAQMKNSMKIWQGKLFVS